MTLKDETPSLFCFQCILLMVSRRHKVIFTTGKVKAVAAICRPLAILKLYYKSSRHACVNPHKKSAKAPREQTLHAVLGWMFDVVSSQVSSVITTGFTARTLKSPKSPSQTSTLTPKHARRPLIAFPTGLFHALGPTDALLGKRVTDVTAWGQKDLGPSNRSRLGRNLLLATR